MWAHPIQVCEWAEGPEEQRAFPAAEPRLPAVLVVAVAAGSVQAASGARQEESAVPQVVSQAVESLETRRNRRAVVAGCSRSWSLRRATV